MKFNSSILFSGLVVFATLLTGCDTYSHMTPTPDKEQMEARPHVYGEPGQPAYQSKQEYPDNPDAAARSAELKKKLYSDDNTVLRKLDDKIATE